MRLFWKLFCAMVMIAALTCSVGGYVLIDGQFRDSLDREVAALYEENDLLRYTLARELADQRIFDREELGRLVGGIHISTGRGTVTFRISDEAGSTIVTSGALAVAAAPLTGQLPQGQRGWELVEERYLHAASPLLFGEETLYLENCRDVADLFSSREAQYHSFFFLMLGLTAAVGILSFAVAGVMLHPLAQLSAATKKMAAGNLKQRVQVESRDELGTLSADFNAMAEQLERTVQELKDAAQRQEDFMASFAHEIKTPLTSIIGYADLLRSREMTAEQTRQSAGYIFSEGRRLEALSRKLMDLIVLENQDFPLRTVEMSPYLQRIGGALEPALAKKSIRLRIRAEDGSIPLEPDLMETVLLNLLDNARKAIDQGGVILLEGFCEKNGYCIRVTDNGKGIPAGELGRITEAFYMVDKSRARAQGGAGLGLAVCQRIVALHGGSMEFHSTEGKGTSVLVHLKGGDAE